MNTGAPHPIATYQREGLMGGCRELQGPIPACGYPGLGLPQVASGTVEAMMNGVVLVHVRCCPDMMCRSAPE